MLSGKEVLSVHRRPSDAAAPLGPQDSDPNRPAIRGCRHSPLAIDFHTLPALQGHGSKLHSETADPPRAPRVPPPMQPQILLKFLAKLLAKFRPKIPHCPSASPT